MQIEKNVTIFNKSPEELYRFWRNFENLPKFMKHVQSVQVINERRSHWIAAAPLGGTIEWDAELTKEQEHQSISWASVGGSDVHYSGFVQFQPSTQHHGTEVKVVMQHNLPGEEIVNTIAKLFGKSSEQQIGEDLRHFKMLMETGEIATTEGQSRGHQ